MIEQIPGKPSAGTSGANRSPKRGEIGWSPLQSEGPRRFGPFEFHPRRRLLFRGVRRIDVGEKAIAMLGTLIRHEERVVTYQELVAAAWPMNSNATFHDVQQAMRPLLKTLVHRSHRFIETIDGRGYCFNPLPNDLAALPKVEAQVVRWGPVEGRNPGILIDGTRQFVPWDTLKSEVEERLLIQLGRHIPIGCSVQLDAFRGRENWLVRILRSDGGPIGYVWFGPNPDNKWEFDGLVRVGEEILRINRMIVWQVFQRYSDGSYRRIEARTIRRRSAPQEKRSSEGPTP